MSFRTIKGHQRQLGVLTKAVKSRTVPHAYLFTGISGIGKMLVARTLAKALNCTVRDDDCCDACTSCAMINVETHPDVQVISPDGEHIKITQIRAMQEQLHYARLYGRYRLVLLDAADTMSLQSANCLLKTIEEPPPDTVIILATTLPYQLPATIRSRCQRIAFQPLSPQLIEEAVQESLGSQKNPRSRLAAALAGGSLGKALRWMETDALTRRQQLLGLMVRPHHPDLTAILDYADEAGEDREALIELLDFLRLWFRDLMIAKETGGFHRLINLDLIDEARSAAERLSWSYLFTTAERISEVQSALKGTVNPRIALEHFLFMTAETPACTHTPSSSKQRTAFIM